MTVILCVFFYMNAQTVVNMVQNPYADVNWGTYQQYKGNFHTHTTYSDGSESPNTVINAYASKGYKILAMTDHNFVLWPWNSYGAPTPESLGMLGVRGDEFSNSDHDNGFFNFTLTSATLEQAIPNVQTNNGRSHINHPGRTHAATDWAWFIPWYRDYSTNIGIEVYNQGDRYPTDRQLWDNINTNLFPAEDKMVWGFSNDDMHTLSHLYHNYQFMLMPALTQADLTTCMDEGVFYFCYEPSGTGTANVPRISGIAVDDVNKTISITATGYTSISWIGPGTTVVGTGASFNYSAYTNKAFVRAVLDGSNGDSFTQPFGFETVVTTPPTADFTADKTSIAFGQSVNFTDTSANNPASWAWTFTGGNPSSSTLENPSVVYNAMGTYEVSLTATNAYGSDTETKTGYITVSNTGSVSISVTSGADDVEQTSSDGAMYIDSSDLEFNDDSRDQDVGIRFNGVSIPKGATITSAYIQVKAKDNDSNTLNHIKFAGHAYDNAPAFGTAAYSLSSRPKTTNTVTWTNPPAWTANSTYNFPSMTAVVQEIVNRTGWASGNSMSFIFWKDDTDADERNAFAYEGGTAAKLIIEFSLPVSVTPGVPSNVVTSISGTNLVIDWDAAANATSYDVYSAGDPYGTFTFEANVLTNQYAVPYTTLKKFYYIVSKNATK